MLKFKLSSTSWKIIYKLLNDLLFVLLIFLGFSLLTDGLITGLITKHISFLKIVLLIALDLIAIYKIGNLVNVSFQKQKRTFLKNKTTIFLVIMAIFLIFNSLIKLTLWLNFFVLSIALVIIYLVYQNLNF